MTARGLIIGAPRSGSGKTSVTIGLLRALKRRGLSISPAGVRCVWQRHDLTSMKLRLKALDAKAAQDKIAQAEAAALSEIRTLSADAATAAAEKLILARLDAKRAGDLIAQSIKDLSSKLN